MMLRVPSSLLRLLLIIMRTFSRFVDQDPWIRPLAAEKMLRLYPQAKKVGLAAGHWYAYVK